MAIQIIPAPAPESPPTPQLPTLVLFGRNRGGKPCAAWFDGAQAEAASAAAATMKLHVLSIADDDQRALAVKLAQGRILSSGKAHVPGARRELYGRLVALSGDGAGLNVTERPEQRGEATDVAGAKNAVGGTQQPAEAVVPDKLDCGGASAAVSVAGTDAAYGPAKPMLGDHNFVGSPIPASATRSASAASCLLMREQMTAGGRPRLSA